MPPTTDRLSVVIDGDAAQSALVEELEVWEHQPGESLRAYAAFAQWRDLGPLRGLRQVARKGPIGSEADGDHPGIATYKHVAAWSKAWNWVERARAWDAHLDLVSRFEQERARRDMARRHADIAAAALEIVTRRLLGDEAAGLTSFDPKDLTASDVVRWLEVSQKVARLALGEPDTITQHQGPEGGPIQQRVVVDDAASALANMRVLEEAGAFPEGGADKVAQVLGIAVARDEAEDESA